MKVSKNLQPGVSKLHSQVANLKVRYVMPWEEI